MSPTEYVYAWPRKAGAFEYRVTARNMLSGETVGVLRGLTVNSCGLPEDWLGAPEHIAIRVEARGETTEQAPDGWSTWLPFAHLGALHHGPTMPLSPCVSRSEFEIEPRLYRLLVRDAGTLEIIHDAAWRIERPKMPLPEALLGARSPEGCFPKYGNL